MSEFLSADDLRDLTPPVSSGLNAGLRAWQAERRADREAVQPHIDAAAKAWKDGAPIRAQAAARATNAKRRAAKRNQTPPWADLDAIRAVYSQAATLAADTGTPHHVDHVIPLRGRLVSGLHVHQNLRVVQARDNLSKGNKFDPC